MKTYPIASAKVVRYPIVAVLFEDGLAGEIDMAPHIEDGTIFQPLKDPSLFDRVSVAAAGSAFGWNFDQIGHEIDLGADNVRIEIETQKVHELAEQYRSRRTAAE